MTQRRSGMSDDMPTRENWILGIDTSTEQAGLALGNGSRLYERSWAAGRTQTTTILAAVDVLLQEACVRVSDLRAIAIATGPVAFTGLRVGMSIAKGLALARDLPLVGISTLDIVAAEAPDATDLVALLPVGRGWVVWQRYGESEDRELRNTTVPELVDYLAAIPEVLAIGELLPEHQATIDRAHSRTRWENRRPSVLLELARERWIDGQRDDPVTLEPNYVHGVAVVAGPVRDRLRRKGT